MAIYNVFHISDLHFGSESRRDSYERALEDWRQLFISERKIGLQGTHCPILAQEVARKVREISLSLDEVSLSLDAVIISGDISTTGMQQDLLEAWQFVSARPGAKEQHLTPQGKGTLFHPDGPEILLMPGNHDRFTGPLALPRSLNFEQIFLTHWVPNKGVQHKIIKDYSSSDHLAFIFADFSLNYATDASPFQNYPGQGLVHEEVKRELVLRTRRIRSDHNMAGIVWVLHFPPTETCDFYPDTLKLNRYREVVYAAQSNNISLILAGHIHRSIDFRDGSILISCAGAACTFVEHNFEGNWIHLITIEVAGGSARIVERQDFEFDQNVGQFEKAPRRKPDTIRVR